MLLEGLHALDEGVSPNVSHAFTYLPFGFWVPEARKFRTIKSYNFAWSPPNVVVVVVSGHDGVVVRYLAVVEVPGYIGQTIGLETVCMYVVITLLGQLVQGFCNRFVHVLWRMF